ncbi:MAG: SRPBCC family protein [Actinomycetota bacterium]|nr:SRPBCC family protein [Actinomycetota bacterium]
MTIPSPRNAHFVHSATLAVEPARVYAVISDYKVHHPAILPKEFSRLKVLKGGVGAGTYFEFDATIAGKTQTSRMHVTEPEPGRVLVETEETGNVETRFVVEPLDGGTRTRLTFDSEYTVPAGFLAPLFRWLSRRLMSGIYRREMQNIESYVRDGRDQLGATVGPLRDRT